MSNNDPTGFKAYFPWIHPTDWTYPAPNHSQGLLDALGTMINIVSHRTHTHAYFHRPEPPVDPNEVYPENIPDKVWGEQKTHPADNIHIYGIKLQSDYFKQTEKDDPEHSHFTLWLTDSDIIVSISAFRVIIPKGTPVCLNPMKTSIGVQKGKVRHEGSKLVSYTREWIHPNKKYFKWDHAITKKMLIELPEVARMPHTMHTPPDFD